MNSDRKLKHLIENFSKERDWEQFHSPKNLAMALSVEASELVELFQWLTEEESKKLSKETIKMLQEEIADVYIYLIKIAGHFSINIQRAALEKMAKNARKYPVNKARGSAKKYNQL